MDQITKERVAIKHNLKPKRCCFADQTGIQKKKTNGSRSFSVKFSESIKPIFEEQTGYKLSYSQEYRNYYRVIRSDEELNRIVDWEQKQGSRLFLRDCLSLSLALDTNLIANEPKQYTTVGQLEAVAKKRADPNSIIQLAELTKNTIQSLPYFSGADFICAVPHSLEKKFDLPSLIVSNVCQKLSKKDITSGFIFREMKEFKTSMIAFDQKWDAWEKTNLFFDNNQVYSVKNKTVILIDDKYQSGMTIQYVGMKLQQAGARQVYGLTMVKTLRDTDNI